MQLASLRSPQKIVAKCNENDVDLDVSIHLNSGRNDYEGDEKTGGTEVFIYSKESKAAQYAVGVAEAIADLHILLRLMQTE